MLETLKGLAIADKNADDLMPADIVDLARALSDGRKPQTVQNYLSQLSAVLRVGRVACAGTASARLSRRHLPLPTAGISPRRGSRHD